MSGQRTIYLSGPMRGYPESNYPAFWKAAADLRALGHSVYNPADFPHDVAAGPFPIRRAFAEYCKFICEQADTLVVLPGWEASRGAGTEVSLAKNCGLDVVPLAEIAPMGCVLVLPTKEVEP